jgi:hypothetical protein
MHVSSGDFLALTVDLLFLIGTSLGELHLVSSLNSLVLRWFITTCTDYPIKPD